MKRKELEEEAGHTEDGEEEKEKISMRREKRLEMGEIGEKDKNEERKISKEREEK